MIIICVRLDHIRVLHLGGCSNSLSEIITLTTATLNARRLYQVIVNHVASCDKLERPGVEIQYHMKERV